MVVDSQPQPGADPGEVGAVTINQPDADTWHTVDLVNRYSNAVVIMQPASFNGGHPTTIRIRNVTQNSFEFQMDEWDYLDGVHTTETIGYLVLEAGTYQLANGIRIDAGVVEADHDFFRFQFYQTFTTTPVVLTQVQTDFGGSAVTTRQRGIDAKGFEVKVQEEEGNDGTHALETVGYVAIEPGAGMMGEMAFEVQRTANAVDHTWYTIDFQQSYSSPVFLAGMQSYNGGNTAGVRFSELAAEQTRVFVEEEQSADDEVWHVTEVVGFAVFDHAGSLALAGPPPAPTGLNPPDGAVITTASVTLSCELIADALQYEFEIWFDNNGTWQYYHTYNPQAASQTFWPVFDDSAYRWRVRAENDIGVGAWSEWRVFDFK